MSLLPKPLLPQIIIPAPIDYERLARLFAVIAADPDAVNFHPHPFDAAHAKRICSYAGSDLYCSLRIDDDFVAYAMLRGWDEGYQVPSLGIYLKPCVRGSGAALILMEFLHYSARKAGANLIRLKVYPHNRRALTLYQKLGYEFDPALQPDGQLLGVLNLSYT